MQNNISIEDQVAQLTEDQQNKIIHIAKIATIIDSIIIALMLLWCVGGMYLVFVPPLGIALDPIKIGIGIIAGGVIGFMGILGVSLFVKMKYPFYSDAKLKHLKKLRKG